MIQCYNSTAERERFLMEKEKKIQTCPICQGKFVALKIHLRLKHGAKLSQC